MSERKQRITFVGTLLVALLVFVLAFGVVSCGGPDGGSNTNPGGSGGDGKAGGGSDGRGDGSSDVSSLIIEAGTLPSDYLC